MFPFSYFKIVVDFKRSFVTMHVHRQSQNFNFKNISLRIFWLKNFKFGTSQKCGLMDTSKVKKSLQKNTLLKVVNLMSCLYIQCILLQLHTKSCKKYEFKISSCDLLPSYYFVRTQQLNVFPVVGYNLE